MKRSRKTNGPSLDQALEKAERFYGKRNFPLAKRELEEALRLGPSEQQAREISGKLEICAREVAVLERRETIKRGKRLEKKGRYREALEQFEEALASGGEAWIEDRIAALEAKLHRTEACELLDALAEDEGPEVRLSAYDRALVAGHDPALAQGKANCLVELGRFDEAISLFTAEPPSSDLSRYRYGFAYASVGRFLEALTAWHAIETRPEGWVAQVEQILPFACREADREGGADSYGVIVGIAGDIDRAAKSERFLACEKYAACARLRAFWEQERYEEMAPLLPPLGKPPDREALLLHARVELKLAERDVAHLEPAIALWLTAAYDDTLLGSLAAHRAATEPVDQQALRTKLVGRLGELVQCHAREGRLSPRLEGIWKMEERLVRQLSAFPVEGTRPPIYPCTPGFARRYGLAEDIGVFLSGQGATAADAREELLELRAYFSAAGEAMMWVEAGEDQRALASIPRGIDDDLLRYCRNRISLACGMAKARRGESQVKRFFLEALELLEAQPKRVQEIVDLAYLDEPAAFFDGLADAMEALCRRIDTSELRKATAHAMATKAVGMLNRDVSPTTVQKLLQRAQRIYPSSDLVGTTMEMAEEMRVEGGIRKALKRNGPLRAARQVVLADSSEARHYYFETMERWRRDILSSEWSASERSLALTEIHEGCRLVDATHPLTYEVFCDLRELDTT